MAFPESTVFQKQHTIILDTITTKRLKIVLRLFQKDRRIFFGKVVFGGKKQMIQITKLILKKLLPYVDELNCLIVSEPRAVFLFLG